MFYLHVFPSIYFSLSLCLLKLCVPTQLSWYVCTFQPGAMDSNPNLAHRMLSNLEENKKFMQYAFNLFVNWLLKGMDVSWAIPGIFYLFYVFSRQLTVNECSILKFADDLIQTTDLWCRSRPQKVIYVALEKLKRTTGSHMG